MPVTAGVPVIPLTILPAVPVEILVSTGNLAAAPALAQPIVPLVKAAIPEDQAQEMPTALATALEETLVETEVHLPEEVRLVALGLVVTVVAVVAVLADPVTILKVVTEVDPRREVVAMAGHQLDQVDRLEKLMEIRVALPEVVEQVAVKPDLLVHLADLIRLVGHLMGQAEAVPELVDRAVLKVLSLPAFQAPYLDLAIPHIPPFHPLHPPQLLPWTPFLQQGLVPLQLWLPIHPLSSIVGKYCILDLLWRLL
jgi:hypothetical protein